MPSSLLIAALALHIHTASFMCLLILCDYHFYSLPVCDMVFGGCVVCKGGLVGGGLRLLFASHVLFFCAFSTSFLWSFSLALNNLPDSPM